MFRRDQGTSDVGCMWVFQHELARVNMLANHVHAFTLCHTLRASACRHVFLRNVSFFMRVILPNQIHYLFWWLVISRAESASECIELYACMYMFVCELAQTQAHLHVRILVSVCNIHTYIYKKTKVWPPCSLAALLFRTCRIRFLSQQYVSHRNHQSHGARLIFAPCMSWFSVSSAVGPMSKLSVTC